MLDCVIRGGTLIDGGGEPGQPGDLGIREGRIVARGEVSEPARQTLDAKNAVVAPGFVDIHTHYDAQAFWDPTLSPSPLHGVTTVIGGNCGFTIAPLNDEAADYLRPMLARVEGMPLESLEAGVPWNWRSFGEYLDQLEDTLAINAGFLVGHCALRRVVMGEEAVGHEAKPEQIDAMVQLLHESLAAGGLGFSSTRAPTHNDGNGKPVPSRYAAREEFLALAGALRDHPGTTLEFIPAVGPFNEEAVELMCSMSLAANRPINWNVLQPSSFNPELHTNQLSASDYAAERGGRVVALTLPQQMELRLNFRTAFVFDALPGWGEIVTLPLEKKKRALADPSVRQHLRERAASPEAGIFGALANWERMTVAETFVAENEGLAGKTLGEIARDRGQDPFDVMLDLALSEDLQTSFIPFMPFGDEDLWRMRAEVWQDPRTVVGASDAGAHLDMVHTFCYATWLLGTAVREKQLLSLEQAVHQLTQVPAELYGVRDRGRLALGSCADIVVFDADRIGSQEPYTRYDLPAGAGRLYAEADGIRHVLVNGAEIVRGNEFTNARPGRLLRSGRDTETVEVPGGRS